jgi:hypothetical protein
MVPVPSALLKAMGLGLRQPTNEYTTNPNAACMTPRHWTTNMGLGAHKQLYLDAHKICALLVDVCASSGAYRIEQ